MSTNINMDTPRTGIPNEAFKAGWDSIFGKTMAGSPARPVELTPEEIIKDLRAELASLKAYVADIEAAL